MHTEMFYLKFKPSNFRDFSLVLSYNGWYVLKSVPNTHNPFPVLSSGRYLHCDLKPDNIMLQYENKSKVKIIDLG